MHPVNANIPPDQISLSNLACLNRVLAYKDVGYVQTGSSDATDDIRFRSAGRCGPGARALLVSTHVLRQYGLLPGCLRPSSPACSMSPPATYLSVSKCSQVRTCTAMCVSDAAAITARSARSLCQTCSGACPIHWLSAPILSLDANLRAPRQEETFIHCSAASLRKSNETRGIRTS